MISISRLVILNVVVLATCSLVFLLPSGPSEQPVGINLRLPDFVGEWFGTDMQVSQKEIQVLGPGTEFARKSYTNGRGDEINVSVVLAGQDMNTSIHRPERCLPAQGWTMVTSTSRPVPLGGAGNERLEVTRLHNVRPLLNDRAEPVLRDGRPVKIHSLNYYWFTGLTDTTNSHWTRTWYDIRDRVLRGYNQRWAYITVTSVITEGLVPFGRNEEQTDAMLSAFIAKLVPLIHKGQLVGGRDTD